MCVAVRGALCREVSRLQDEVWKHQGSSPTPGQGAELTGQTRYWTAEEHQRFVDAIGLYGPKDVRQIANFVGTRNATQVRTHAQKYFLKISRESKSWHTPQVGDGGKGGYADDERGMHMMGLPPPQGPMGVPPRPDGRMMGAQHAEWMLQGGMWRIHQTRQDWGWVAAQAAEHHASVAGGPMHSGEEDVSDSSGGMEEQMQADTRKRGYEQMAGGMHDHAYRARRAARVGQGG